MDLLLTSGVAVTQKFTPGGTWPMIPYTYATCSGF
jgi:hypothetical protein